jgi:Pyruvate/2-oxoacid:ferredoxin oxidoreductase delta subunit
MFEDLVNYIEGMLSPMKFRETAMYRRYFDRFGEALKAYYELEGELDGLEDLMLKAYSMAKFLRRANDIKISQFAGKFRPIDTAIMEAVELMDSPLEACVPPYIEADTLDELSFSAFKVLKNAGEINYCKDCKNFQPTTCKAHKAPTSVYDMFYCKGCRGFITTMCVVHGPEMCGPPDSMGM